MILPACERSQAGFLCAVQKKHPGQTRSGCFAVYTLAGNKPGSVSAIIYLGYVLPRISSDLPKTTRAALSFLLGLAPDGVYQADWSPSRWCALTAPFHPYPQAVCFLWHFPSGNPWEIPVSRFHGTRCLVMSGLSSTPARRPEQRPPEPDRHGLHTLSSARGKAQSRHGKNFVSFFLPLPSSSQWAPSSLNKVKRPQDCSRGRSNLLPMKTSLIH